MSLDTYKSVLADEIASFETIKERQKMEAERAHWKERPHTLAAVMHSEGTILGLQRALELVPLIEE